MTTAQLTFGDLSLDVKFKNIKNVHLSVHPPHGNVTIAAPSRMSLDVIRAYAVTKIGWIRRQQRKLQEAERAPQIEFLDRESHYVWGQRYLLRQVISEGSKAVQLSPGYLALNASPLTAPRVKEAMLSKWYREQIQAEAPAIVARWAKVLGVQIPSVRVRQMKTKWGSCNHETASILLNTDLAKKPRECLQYVLLHEMAHLIEPTHNVAFTTIMDKAMPNWRTRRDMLNGLPVPHELQAGCAEN
jgi:predicted metal-dependent hydrolase